MNCRDYAPRPNVRRTTAWHGQAKTSATGHRGLRDCWQRQGFRLPASERATATCPFEDLVIAGAESNANGRNPHPEPLTPDHYSTRGSVGRRWAQRASLPKPSERTQT